MQFDFCASRCLHRTKIPNIQQIVKRLSADEQIVMNGQEFPNPSRPERNAAFLPMREATRASCGGLVKKCTGSVLLFRHRLAVDVLLDEITNEGQFVIATTQRVEDTHHPAGADH